MFGLLGAFSQVAPVVWMIPRKRDIPAESAVPGPKLSSYSIFESRFDAENLEDL